MIQTENTCRHFDDHRNICAELRIMNPSPLCRTCDHYEPKENGLGDTVEKLIGITTLGQGKRIASAVARATGKTGGCGCGKRRAALNRIGSLFGGNGLGDESKVSDGN